MKILRELREQNCYSQKVLADYLGISRQGYCNYEVGKRSPDIYTLSKIAKFYNVSVDALLRDEIEYLASPGAVKIPVLGVVPAGIPIEAIEDIIDWEEIPEKMLMGGKEYFALQVKGDSMYPKYLDGDIVIVRVQPDCDSRDDCVVYVNGNNATLKTVRKHNDGSITITPINPEYAPRTFSVEELENGALTIAGIVVEMRRKIR